MSINKVVFVIFPHLAMTLSTHQLDSNQDIGSVFLSVILKNNSGPSGLGKTEFFKRMIEFQEHLFDILPKVLFCVTRNGKCLIISNKKMRGQT